MLWNPSDASTLLLKTRLNLKDVDLVEVATIREKL